MPTLIYTPGIRVYIDTEKRGIIDVSEDLISGTMQRRSDGVSTFDFALNNARRKYDGVFTPNDRIVVLMKRVTWLRTFTGYLNSVPLKTGWPTEVQMGASCSLKRLQYWHWDPNNQQTQDMMANVMGEARAGSDGTIITLILAILERVVGWPASKAHIGRIPSDWYSIIGDMAKRVDAWAEDAQVAIDEMVESLGLGATIAGQGVGDDGLGGAAIAGNATGTLTSGKYDGLTMDAGQRRNAETIYNVGASMGLGNRDIVIGLATAMQESTLRNLHRGDRDSQGLFQQRPSQGWGTVKQITTPTYAARKFFEVLKQVANRDKKVEWQVAYEVQRCAEAYKTYYQKWVPMARAMVAEINAAKKKGAAAYSGTGTSYLPAGGGSSRTKSNVRLRDIAIKLVEDYPNIPYRQAQTDVRRNPPAFLDCSLFTQAVLVRALGSFGGCPRVSSQQAAWTRRVSTTTALNTPGALVFVSRNGQASGVHHVEMTVGDGRRTVGAHRPGRPASVTSNSPSYWSFGGLIPGIAYGGVGKGSPTAGSGGAKVHVGGTGIWPVAAKAVTTGYKKPGSWSAGYHTGVDFGGANTGDTVSSITEGKVVGAGDYGAYGLCVRVMSGGVMVLYAHLSQVSVSNGDRVSPRQKLGEVGNTGRSFGAHLHLEVRHAPYGYGDDVSPVKFITEGVYTSDGGAADNGGIDDFSSGDVSGAAMAPTVEILTGDQALSYDEGDPIDQLFGNNKWIARPVTGTQEALLANSLTGALTLLNDTPLLGGYLKNLFTSTMRSFCSAPNGDLIGWFPDYYGIWGTAAKLRIEPIEIIDFNIYWSDDAFVTHQFTQSGIEGLTALDLGSGSVSTAFESYGADGSQSLTVLSTTGIANIDIPEMLHALFGIKPNNAAQFATWVYDRFGARPAFIQTDAITGPKGAFFAAIYYFMQGWAWQYNSQVAITWMPEAWPGMLMQVPSFDFQAYIATVTHSFQMGEQGSFETTVNITAPAYMPQGKTNSKHALFGLPLAGGYASSEGLGQPPKNDGRAGYIPANPTLGGMP